MKKLIFGLGSGRCGTYSLAKLFELNGVNVSHESFTLPWETDPYRSFSAIASLLYRDSDIVGDVGFYWINYVDEIIKYVRKPKMVCMIRDKYEVVESFLRIKKGKNYWTSPVSRFWDKNDDFESKILSFPKYNLPKASAIEMYWEEYYIKAKHCQVMYPDNFKMFDMRSVLNTEDAQQEMLDFVGIKNPVIDLSIKRNGSGDSMFEQHAVDGGECMNCGKGNALWFVHNRTSGMGTYCCNDCVEKVKETLTTHFRGK